MTAVAPRRPIDFALDSEHVAHEPPEARGIRRDQVRLLVSAAGSGPVDARFDELGAFLRPGDLLVVNTSATVAAALDGRLPDGEPVAVHLSGALPGGLGLVEVRRIAAGTTSPLDVAEPVAVALLSGGSVRLLERFAGSRRLWVMAADLGVDVEAYLGRHGRPIRYAHVPGEWPLACYQTVFARESGSAEMPSAGRPFSSELVTELVSRGVLVAPIVLHTGVSSLEGGEMPYPERYRVPPTTAALANTVRRSGGRVVAVGTTVVRALATTTEPGGQVHPGEGWTEVVVTPDNPVASVDGLLTGWHEPESTHLLMLEAIAEPEVLTAAYATALDLGYRWHEFGDSHLILRGRDESTRAR
jgi:S-adenosylmethionine:tRNA ribosyltransferase-isomerase